MLTTFVSNTLFFQNFKVVLFWLAFPVKIDLPKLTCLDRLFWLTSTAGCSAVLSRLSCAGCLVLIFRNSCPVPAVMFFLPCTVLTSCYFMAVLSQHSSPYLSCPSCPVLASMSDGPVLSILSCVICPSCPGQAVQSQLSCSCCPVLVVLGCAYMVVQ